MASSTSDPYLTPAMEAPPGLHFNLIDPKSTDYSTFIIYVLVIVLSTPFVVVRLYTRKFITRLVWWDDRPCSLDDLRYASNGTLMGCDRVVSWAGCSRSCLLALFSKQSTMAVVLICGMCPRQNKCVLPKLGPPFFQSIQWGKTKQRLP